VDPTILAALQDQIDALFALTSPVISTPPSLPDAAPGQEYDQLLAAGGGTPPYTWSVAGGALPSGLSLTATGHVAGAVDPAASGSHSFVAQATDANGHLAQRTFQLLVAGSPGAQPALDVVLLVDTTGSMGGAISNLQASLLDIVTRVRALDPNAAFAVTAFQDFPYGTFGDGSSPGDGVPDFPYTVRVTLATDVVAVQNAVNSLVADGGGDAPESGTEALYLAATGEGVSWPASDKPAGSIPPAPLGFREGSRRVIVAITDATFHDGPEYVAAGILEAHSATQAAQALDAEGLHVIGVAIARPGVPSPRSDLEGYARATGARVPVESFGGALCLTGIDGAGLPPDPDGSCPLVYDVADTGVGLTTLAQGIELLWAGWGLRPADRRLRARPTSAPDPSTR
jgi:hypothetical protein